MRRKAFWGQSGSIRRRTGGHINGKLLDCEVSAYGVRMIEVVENVHLPWLPWAELHRLAQQKALEQLGAAVAERSEPPFEEGSYICTNCGARQSEHAIDRRSNQQVFLQRATPGKVLCNRTGCIVYRDERASEPRILPVEENK